MSRNETQTTRTPNANPLGAFTEFTHSAKIDSPVAPRPWYHCLMNHLAVGVVGNASLVVFKELPFRHPAPVKPAFTAKKREQYWSTPAYLRDTLSPDLIPPEIIDSHQHHSQSIHPLQVRVQYSSIVYTIKLLPFDVNLGS
jgi:hypothetical protein